MKHIKLTRIALITVLVIVTVVTTGCFKKAGPAQPKTTDDLQQILANQSKLKKFKSAQELKDFFAQRPNVARGSAGYAANTLQARDVAVKESAPAVAMPAPDGFGGDAQGGLGAGGGFSGTNIQVQGVDEADLVKTDGQYLYMVKEQDLVILKATPPAEATVASTTDLQGIAQELYLKDNRVAVFGYNQTPISASASPLLRYFPSATFFALYDITDRAHPTLLRRLEFEGNYVSSRLIDNKLYFISAYYNFYPLAADVSLPRVLEQGNVISAEQTTDKYIFPTVYYIDSPSSLNATTVTTLKLDDINAPLNSQVFLMPAGETVYASTSALYIAYTKYISEYQLRMAVTREIVAPKMSDRERQRLAAINAIEGDILSDEEKLMKINQILETYLSRISADDLKQLNNEIEVEFKRRHPDLANELEKTVVHKLTFTGDSLDYVGAGEVTGRLLNQYSLDEKDGYLRLATTRNQQWFQPFVMPTEPVADKVAPEFVPQPEAQSINNVYVLNQSLQTVGRLENLAPGERIYSARFMGDRAYLVTFKQTDPLFVIDLSAPDKPTVLGELKLPGFSNYLHPYSENILLGIGKEAIDKGDQGVEMRGLKVSLFDVSQPNQPREIDSLTFGGPGSDSMALMDYKAVLFDKERNLLVIPASLTATNSTTYQATFQGSLVLTVTPEGVTERGRVAFRLPTEMSAATYYVDDSVRRNLYIGDNLYSLSAATLKISQLERVSLIKSLDLPRRPLVNEATPPIMPYVKTETLPAPSR